MSTGTLPTPTASRAYTALRWALTLLLLAFVGWQLSASGGELLKRAAAPAPGPFLLASAGLALHLANACWLWRQLVRGLGVELPYRTAFSILFRSNLAKYLPGSVWNLVGRVVLAERAGVPKLACSISLLMETACQVTAALVVGLLTLPLFAHTAIADPRLLALVVLGVVLGMHPRVLNSILALGERVAGKPVPRLPFSYPFVLAVLGGYVLNWLLLGASFATLGQAFSVAPLTFAQLGLLAGAFAIAWNAGVFAFFAPAGLGVREAALVLLTGAAFAPGWPALLAITTRVWFTVGELLAFALATAWAKGPAGPPDPG